MISGEIITKLLGLIKIVLRMRVRAHQAAMVLDQVLEDVIVHVSCILVFLLINI